MRRRRTAEGRNIWSCPRSFRDITSDLKVVDRMRLLPVLGTRLDMIIEGPLLTDRWRMVPVKTA